MKQYFDIGDSTWMQQYFKLKEEGKDVDVYVVLRWDK